MSPYWSSFLASTPSEHSSFISHIPMKPLEANSRFKKYNEIVKSSSSGSVSRLNLKPTGIILGTPSSPRVNRLNTRPANTQHVGLLDETQRQQRIPQRGSSTTFRQTYSQHQPQYQYQKMPSQSEYGGGQQDAFTPQTNETDETADSTRPSVLVRPMSLPLHLKSLKSGCAFKEPYHTSRKSPGVSQKPSIGWARRPESPNAILNPPGTLVASPTITTRPGYAAFEIKPSSSSSTGIPVAPDTVSIPLPSGIPKAKSMQNQQSEQIFDPSLTSKYQNISSMQQQVIRERQLPVYQLIKPTGTQSRLYGAQPRHSSCGSVGPTPMPHGSPVSMPGPQYLQCALEQYISDLLTGECRLHYNEERLLGDKAGEREVVWRGVDTTTVPGPEGDSGSVWHQSPSSQVEALQFLEQRIQNALNSLQQKRGSGRYGNKPSRDRSFSFTASLPTTSNSTTARHQLRCPGQSEAAGLAVTSSFDPYVNANSDGSPISLTSSSYEAGSDPHQQQQACYNHLYARGSLTNVTDRDKASVDTPQDRFNGSMLGQFSEDELRYLLAAVKDLVDLRCADTEALASYTSPSESKSSLQSAGAGNDAPAGSGQAKCDHSITTALMHQRLPLGFQHFERYLDSKFGPDQSGQSVIRQSLENAPDQDGHSEWGDYLTVESSVGLPVQSCDSSVWYARHPDVPDDQIDKRSEVSRAGREQQPPARPPRSAARIIESQLPSSSASVETKGGAVAAPNLPDTTSMQSLQSSSFEGPSPPTYQIPPGYLLDQSNPMDFYLSFLHHFQPASREPLSPPRPPRSPMCPTPSRSHHSHLLASPPLPVHSMLSTRGPPATGLPRDKPGSYHHCLHHGNHAGLGQSQSSHPFLHAHSHQHHSPQYHNSQQQQHQQSYCSTPETPDPVPTRDRWCPTPPPTTAGQGLPFLGYPTPTGHCSCNWPGPVAGQEVLASSGLVHQRNTSLEGQMPAVCYACCSADHLMARHRVQQTPSGGQLSSPDDCCPMAFVAMAAGAHEPTHFPDCRLESPPNSFFYRGSGGSGGLAELIASRCYLTGNHVQDQQQVTSSRCMAPQNLGYPSGSRMPRSGSAGAGFTYGIEVTGATSPGSNPAHWAFPPSHFSRENSLGPDYSGQRGWSPVYCASPVRLPSRQLRPANESLAQQGCGSGLHNATLMRSMSNSLSANDLAAYLSGHSTGGSSVENRQVTRPGFNLLPNLPSEPALTLIDCTDFFSKVSAFVEIDKTLRPSLPPGWSEDRSSTGRMYYCYCTTSANGSPAPGSEMAFRQFATWQHPLIGPHVPLGWERVDSSQHGVYYQNLLIPHCQRYHPNLWLQVPLKNLATEQEFFFSDLRNLQFSMKHNPPKDLGKQLRISEYKNATSEAEAAAFIDSFLQIKEVEVMVEATHLLDQLFYKELRDLIISAEYERIRLVSLMFTMESAEHIFTQYQEPL